MAKKKKKRDTRIRLSQPQRERFGKDLESLGLGHDTQDVEIRFDVTDPDVKQRIDTLARYGLVSVRQHSAGEKLWRVAMTKDGEAVMADHLAREARKRGKSSASPLLSDQEIKERNTKRDEQFVREGRADGYSQGVPSKGGLSDVKLPPEVVFIATDTLRAFQERATAKGMSRVLTKETLERLDVNGRHRVRDAKKHRSDDGKYTNVRLIMDLQVRQSLLERDRLEVGNVETEQVVVDVTNKDWDMLMVPYHAKMRQDLSNMGGSRPGTGVTYLSAPKWAATRAYGVVHEIHSFYQGHVSAYDRTGWHGPLHLPRGIGRLKTGPDLPPLRGQEAIDSITHPRSLMNAECLDYIHKAHPLVIDPEWVEIQEEWTRNEAWAYAQRVVLPYDPLFLDFEGQGGRMPEVNVLGYKVYLTGCLFYTDAKTGKMVVQPFGGRDMLDITQETGVLSGGYPYEQPGRVVIGGRCDYGHPFDIKLKEAEGEEPDATVDGLYVVPQAYAGVTNEGVACDLPDFAEQSENDGNNEPLPFGVEPHQVPGYFELPLLPPEALLRPRDTAGSLAVPRLMVWNATIGALAVKSLSMLSLIDNEHVELREADLRRHERRSVERDRQKGRDHGIASEIVVVRRQRYVNGHKDEGDGAAIHYSHQFRVRRHEQHHGPHTRTYQAKPWLAKPCGRCGSCRRFIIDSYIKGPADKPLKDKKTYMYQDKEQ